MSGRDRRRQERERRRISTLLELPALPPRLTGADLRAALEAFAAPGETAARKAAAITASLAAGDWRDPEFFERRSGLDRRIEEAIR